MEKKIRCLIVDDEALFREYLRKAVDWAEQGFEIIGEAKNGLQALELAGSKAPDVLFVDIDMPHMDGLHLIDTLQERGSDIFFVLITGYGDFAYAQRAIKLGVSDYLLKPFTQEELLFCLLKIRGKIRQRQVDASEKKAAALLAQTHLLQQLLLGEYIGDEAALLTSFQQYALPFSPTRPVLAAAIRYHDPGEIWSGPQDSSVLVFALRNMLDEIISPEGDIALLRMEKDLLALLIEPGQQVLGNAIDELRTLCSAHLHVHIQAGISGPHQGIAGYGEAWREALAALRSQEQDFDAAVEAGFPSFLGRERPAYLRLLEPGTPQKASWSHLLVVRALRHMTGHYMDDLNAEKIAAQLFVSASYLRKAFAKELGASIMQVLLDIRMSQACVLLSKSYLSIASVAEMTGYNDPAYFSRVFRRYYDMTPSSFEIMSKSLAPV